MWETLWQRDRQIQVPCWPARLLCTKGMRSWWKVNGALQQTWEGAWESPWACPRGPFPCSQPPEEGVEPSSPTHDAAGNQSLSLSLRLMSKLPRWHFSHFSLNLIVRLIYLPEVVGLTIGSCYLSLLSCTHLRYSSEDLKDHGWRCVLSHILN